MRWNILIFGAILFSSNSIFGQVHFLSMNGQVVDSKGFTITEIIDARANRSNVGYVLKGVNNTRMSATFKKPLNEEIANTLSTPNKKKLPELLLLVKGLHLEEKMGFAADRANCYLTVEFVSKENSKYLLVHRSVQESSINGFDVTSRHPKNIARALETAFQELDKIDFSDKTKFKVLSENQVYIDRIEKTYDFPIFNEKIKDGVFETFSDFQKNLPSNSYEFYLEKKARTSSPWLGTFDVNPIFSNFNKIKIPVWGLSIDGEIYIHHQKEFFPLIITENEIYFFGFDIVDNQSSSVGDQIGGLIGASVLGIESAIDQAKAKKRKVKYYINPDTGRFKEMYIVEESK